MRNFRVGWPPNALHPTVEWHFVAELVEFSRPLGAIASVIAPALVRGAVRVSLGSSTGQADIERFLAARRRLAITLCRAHSIAA
jgi:hypothetical protein